ncbi:MAG: hypothetical protein M0T81_04200 [Thermoplasmatales archaeon]|nr:hypothetical protein [Thermoplasmatales archaeon]
MKRIIRNHTVNVRTDTITELALISRKVVTKKKIIAIKALGSTPAVRGVRFYSSGSVFCFNNPRRTRWIITTRMIQSIPVRIKFLVEEIGQWIAP